MGGLQYAAIIIPAMLLIVLAEYMLSRHKGVEAFTLNDTIVNMCCGMLERLFDFFWVVLMFFVFGFLYENVSPFPIPTDLGPWATIGVWIAALFTADFMAYWHHRLSHEINVLWAAHIVHHQSEELNVTTVFRVSAFAVINRSFFWIWIPILGFSPVMTTSVLVFIGLFQFVTHTRLIGKLGWLEYFFVTPSHHRVHHARNEKYLDKNYGHVFIIWDKMFGTFMPEDEEPDYGITTGFASANPYRAYLYYWGDLFRRAKQAPAWQDKIRIFLKPPSWNPEGVEATPSEYQVGPDGKRQKFRIYLPIRLQLYVLVTALSTVSAFIGMFLVKRTLENPSMSELLTHPTLVQLGLVVIISVLALGGLMERKRWAMKLEYIRLGLLAILGPILFWNLPYAGLSIPLLMFGLLILAFWFIRMRNYFEKNPPQTVKTELAVNPVRPERVH